MNSKRNLDFHNVRAPLKRNSQKGVRFGNPELATGKYGCRKGQVYPAECGEELGRDPLKNGSSKSLVLKSLGGREHLGTHSCSSPSHFGIRLYFVRPNFPSPD